MLEGFDFCVANDSDEDMERRPAGLTLLDHLTYLGYLPLGDGISLILIVLHCIARTATQRGRLANMHWNESCAMLEIPGTASKRTADPEHDLARDR